MGASNWRYRIPYQPDINGALQELREDVFAKKGYDKFGGLEKLAERAEKLSPEAAAQIRLKIDMLSHIYPNRVEEADSIEDLIKKCGESGTHSIIDIDHVSGHREFGAMTPLTDEQLIALFGTTQPEAEHVDPKRGGLVRINRAISSERFFDNWEAVYAIIYKNGQPDEIYIEGCSGD